MVQAAYLKSQGLGYPFSRKDGPLIAVSTIFKLKADEIVECMIWLFTSQSIILQLYRDGSSWVEPVLSKDWCFLRKDTT